MTAMNAASRLFPILRLSNLSEHQAVRSFVCASYCKTIKTDLVWQSYPSKCMTSYNTHHSNVLQSRAIDRWTYWGSLNQTLRYSSQNHKVYTSAAQEDSSKQNPREEGDEAEKFQKLSLYGKIKSMYRDYWYVLVPVHLASSAVFLGIFYYAASSGVDIVSIMESLHFSEKVVNTFKDSSAGFIAIAYALYKIFTPVRYTVTLGGTTWAIKLLKARGWIKPRPVKEAKENVHNIISAMKLPEKERQKFLEEKGMPRIGKAVGQASSAVSNLSSKSSKGK